MNPLPGVNLRLRPVEESESWPAIVIGFDSQGKNGFVDSLDRYLVKSPGLYAVLSKNYLLAAFLSLHGAINYSFERGDGDRDINFFFGAEKTLGPFLSLAGEYDLALNDNSQSAIGRGLVAAGSVAEIVVPYHERRPVEPGSKLESNRVDLGAFVHNGAHWSAPSFLSLFYLDNEARVYDAQKRIASVE